MKDLLKKVETILREKERRDTIFLADEKLEKLKNHANAFESHSWECKLIIELEKILGELLHSSTLDAELIDIRLVLHRI